jgi:hypothetical protein
MAVWIPYKASNFAQDDELSGVCLMESKFKFLYFSGYAVHFIQCIKRPTNAHSIYYKFTH